MTGPVLGGREVEAGFSRCGVDVESFRFDFPAPKHPKFSDFPDPEADLGLVSVPVPVPVPVPVAVMHFLS